MDSSPPLLSLRHDKRRPGSLRKIEIIYEGLARTDGSAKFSHGDITALASVSGPIEARFAAEQASQATFEVMMRPLSNVPATEAKSFASAIRAALLPSLILTKQPRTLVQLVVQAISFPRTQWKDGLISAMINSSTLALMNTASIPMRGIVCAVAIGKIPGIGFIVDPSEEEYISLDAGGCFAFLFTQEFGVESVWTSWRSQRGTFIYQDFIDARTFAKSSIRNIYDAMKSSVPWMGTNEPFEPAPSFTKPLAEPTAVRYGKTENHEGDDDNDDKMEI